MKKACIVVLGDLPRSPRMMNHIRSLLAKEYQVTVICYLDSEIPSEFKYNKNLSIDWLHSSFLQSLKRLPRKCFLLYALLRILVESSQLFYKLLRLKGTNFIMLQNPPSLPSMLCIACASNLNRIPWVIDWHNYAYSLLQVNRRSSLLVKVAKAYEVALGRCADSHFTVSHSFAKDLKAKGIESAVLYDRPNLDLPTSEECIRDKIGVDKHAFLCISSTSWTEDEDFSIVIKALDSVDLEGIPMHLVITGKGPLKTYYEEILAKKKWKFCRVTMEWLKIEEYRKLLQECDLGICLHTSSSGLDLPMKVVDMIGAAIPVLSYNYPTIFEFIETKQNGDVFLTPQELSSKMLDYMRNRETVQVQKEYIRNWVQNNTWDTEWKLKVEQDLLSLKRKSVFIQVANLLFVLFIFYLLFTFLRLIF